MGVPPEEFGISRHARSLRDCGYCFHEVIKREGLRSEFVEVSHRPRASGRSKYSNLERLWASLGDLVGVVWLLNRARAPGEIKEP